MTKMIKQWKLIFTRHNNNYNNNNTNNNNNNIVEDDNDDQTMESLQGTSAGDSAQCLKLKSYKNPQKPWKLKTAFKRHKSR